MRGALGSGPVLAYATRRPLGQRHIGQLRHLAGQVRARILRAFEAAELETTLNDVKTRITDSHIISAVLRKQHVLNIVSGLSLARTGARISYATSISISDARAILAAAAQTLGGYFGQVP